MLYQMLYSQATMVLYYIFLFLLGFSCIKLVPHQLTVILGLVSTRAIFWRINIPKIRS